MPARADLSSNGAGFVRAACAPPGMDGFDALLQSLTERLRSEHQREVAELEAKIAELGAASAQSDLPSQGDSVSYELSNAAARMTTRRTASSPPDRGDAATPPSTSLSLKLSEFYQWGKSMSKKNRTPFFQNTATSPCRKEPGRVPTSMRSLLVRIESIVLGHNFELCVAFLITLNAWIMALEAQYHGDLLGLDLGYHSDPPSRHWSWAEALFTACGWFFGLLFTAELLLRVLCHRAGFCFDPWNMLDLVIVTMWLVGELGAKLQVNPQMIRLSRLGKLVRLIRPFRKFKEFYSLVLLATSLKSSLSILLWTSFVLIMVLLFNALVLNQLLVDFYFQNGAFPLSERKEVYRFFGTFTTSIFSFFELTLGNWPPLSRMLCENVSQWFILVTIIHKLAIGFAVVGVFNGVFIQETFKVAKQDNELILRQGLLGRSAHEKKMSKLMSAVSQSNNRRLSADEFRAIFENEEIKAWLATMEFAPQDTDAIFRIMDDETGHLTRDGLIKGVEQYRGPARNIDLQVLMRDHRHLCRLVESHLGQDAQAPWQGGPAGSAREESQSSDEAEDV